MKKASTHISESSKVVDRKTIERNRRIQMKSLCFKLASLIPSNQYLNSSKSKDMLAQQDQLDLAARYIKHMRERIDELKRQKEQAMKSNQANDLILNIDSKLPVLDVRDLGSGVEVTMVTGLNNTFMLSEVISVVEEEGAEVVTASFSTIGHKIFYNVHAQVKISRVGVETTKVYQRLQDLIAPLESWKHM